MPLKCQALKLAKDADHPGEDQDVYGLDRRRGLAVVADGVASAIFSRAWATILCEAVLREPPNPDDQAAFAVWLEGCRRQWQSQIDESRLSWFQKPKLAQGAFSTLVWLQFDPGETDEPSDDGSAASSAERSTSFRARAIGDSCLFHVRDGQTLRMFPELTREQLQRDPLALGSVDLGRDDNLRFESCRGQCQEGDLLVLCSDAIVGYVLDEQEAGNRPPWRRWWDIDRRTWQEEIIALREARKLPHDDTTVLMLQLVPAAGADDDPPPEDAVVVSGAPVPAETAGESEDSSPSARIVLAERVDEQLPHDSDDAVELERSEPAHGEEPPSVPEALEPALDAQSDPVESDDVYGVAEVDDPPPESADDWEPVSFQPWRTEEDDEPLAPPRQQKSGNPLDFDLTDGEQWRLRLQQWSEEMNRQVSDGIDRGWKKMKEAGRSAESAWKKYLDRFRSGD
jgi:serine/threonine protein phosphatase PrpC